ncbi:uncharacterized protein LOC141855348 isoform X1 [Brevipalpus obovatus]|uniref:uncharacterized protein LOC141855348 isoform X1 n=1 Tax=Brevipalpus obovatus TaxID=246614 RepID=UPI003D9DBB69
MLAELTYLLARGSNTRESRHQTAPSNRPMMNAANLDENFIIMIDLEPILITVFIDLLEYLFIYRQKRTSLHCNSSSSLQTVMPRGNSGSLVAVDPMQLIKKIDQEVLELESLEETIGVENQDEQNEYLDEMLTRCMIKLDNIEAGGREDIRGSRKTVLSRIEKCLAKLDTKNGKDKGEKNTKSTA